MNTSLLSLTSLLSILICVNCCRSITDYFPANGSKALAVMKGEFNQSKISGTVLFEQASLTGPLKISINISGIPDNLGPKHGFHVHQTTITSTSSLTSEICGSSGPHFNPSKNNHGSNTAQVRHVGDFGNVISVNGTILFNLTDSISKLYGVNGIIGRTLVLHQFEDDLGLGNNTASLANGNAGARIACGVIGIID